MLEHDGLRISIDARPVPADCSSQCKADIPDRRRAVRFAFWLSILALTAGCSPSYERGTLNDGRDGQTYKTVTIGDLEWMAQNINIGTAITGDQIPLDNGVIEKFAYDDDFSRFESEGGLYTWDEAMQYSREEGNQGICPVGWHLPTDAEWHAFELALSYFPFRCNPKRRGEGCVGAGSRVLPGGAAGFDARYIGTRLKAEERPAVFGYRGEYIRFWTSTEFDERRAIRRGSEKRRSTLDRDRYEKTWGYAVRCVRPST